MYDRNRIETRKDKTGIEYGGYNSCLVFASHYFAWPDRGECDIGVYIVCVCECVYKVCVSVRGLYVISMCTLVYILYVCIYRSMNLYMCLYMYYLYMC